MKRNRSTVEQSIRMLRETEVHLSQRKSIKFCMWTGRGDTLVRTRLSIKRIFSCGDFAYSLHTSLEGVCLNYYNMLLAGGRGSMFQAGA